MVPEINELLQKIKETDSARNLSDIHIAVGDSAIAFLKGRGYDRAISDKYRTIGFSGVMLDDDTVMVLHIPGLISMACSILLQPTTFFQAHWSLNKKAVDLFCKNYFH